MLVMPSVIGVGVAVETLVAGVECCPNPCLRSWWLEHLARKRAEGSSVPRTSIQPMRLVVADGNGDLAGSVHTDLVAS